MSENIFPNGYNATGLNCGIKKDRMDLAVITSDYPAVAAAVYTRNVMKAAPLIVTKNHLDEEHLAQAIVVNSGVANAAMGEVGITDAKVITKKLSDIYQVPENHTIVASTGVIGVRVPVEKITTGIEESKQCIQPLNTGSDLAAHAIMTTDTVPKIASVALDINGKSVRLWGMCKGAGMIHPNMSTMLGFVLSDVAISSELLQKSLTDAVNDSFNMISVDGDTSTNDMVTVLANGCAGNSKITEMDSNDFQLFANALKEICISLAKQIVADGEGATKLFQVEVTGLANVDDAKTIARSICSSSLVKAAIFGKDANWGRIACAAGYSGVEFDPYTMDIYIGNLLMAKNGQGLNFDEEEALKLLSNKEIIIRVCLNQGHESAIAWGCDLTYDYVKINADYRS